MCMNCEEYKIIQEQFNEIIRNTQGIPDPKTDELFRIWHKQKEVFISMFGHKLIYEMPGKVSFELNEQEKHQRVIQFSDDVCNRWGYEELADFIEEQEDGFFRNITVKDYMAWDGKLIKKGTKIVRAFSHFIPDGRSLTDIQNEASRIIQEDKVEGTLCLSVHPLDYLSISENTYNWRSCHSLDGEYRAGNLSYMMDDATVVCYLKGTDNVEIPGFYAPEVKWNSKKWRVLLYVAEKMDMIFAGREYPFSSEAGMNIVLRDLLPQSGICRIYNNNHSWSDWCGTFINSAQLNKDIKVTFSKEYLPLEDALVPLNQVYRVQEGSRQFDDVLSSSCYKPIYTFKCGKSPWGDEVYPLISSRNTVVNVGGNTKCLWCGEEQTLFGADTMLCEKCELEHGNSESELFTNCDCCGARVFEDSTYFVDGEDFCEACFEKYCSHCEECGAAYRSEEIRYYDIQERYLCKHCLTQAYRDEEEKERY